jgi:hypothetical protein
LLLLEHLSAQPVPIPDEKEGWDMTLYRTEGIETIPLGREREVDKVTGVIKDGEQTPA